MEIVQGDYGFTLNFAITSAGSLFDITGGSIFFVTSSIIDKTQILNKGCTIMSAVSGTCSYTAGSMDFTQPGSYYWQLQYQLTGSKILTYQSTELISVIKEL